MLSDPNNLGGSPSLSPQLSHTGAVTGHNSNFGYRYSYPDGYYSALTSTEEFKWQLRWDLSRLQANLSAPNLSSLNPAKRLHLMLYLKKLQADFNCRVLTEGKSIVDWDIYQKAYSDFFADLAPKVEADDSSYSEILIIDEGYLQNSTRRHWSIMKAAIKHNQLILFCFNPIPAHIRQLKRLAQAHGVSTKIFWTEFPCTLNIGCDEIVAVEYAHLFSKINIIEELKAMFGLIREGSILRQIAKEGLRLSEIDFKNNIAAAIRYMSGFLLDKMRPELNNVVISKAFRKQSLIENLLTVNMLKRPYIKPALLPAPASPSLFLESNASSPLGLVPSSSRHDESSSPPSPIFAQSPLIKKSCWSSAP